MVARRMHSVAQSKNLGFSLNQLGKTLDCVTGVSYNLTRVG